MSKNWVVHIGCAHLPTRVLSTSHGQSEVHKNVLSNVRDHLLYSLVCGTKCNG